MKFKGMLSGVECMLGKHQYMSELRTYDVFNTSYTDTKELVYWHVHFLKCVRCGQRKFETNHPKPNKHPGIDKTKHMWLERGHIPDNVKYHVPPGKEKKPVTPSQPTSPVEKIDNMLKKALSTQSEQEAIACLRKARKMHNV